MRAIPDALHVRDIRKRFAAPAVDGLSFRVAPGEIYALLGPNGAGKTTTLRMVVGLLAPDSGSIEVAGIDQGRDPLGARRPVAWLPDEPLLYDRLSAMEYLEFVAGLWQLAPAEAAIRAERLLRLLGLWERRADRCEAFSRGMKQKLCLAGALIHEPALLVLDEPLTGLDAESARLVKDILRARTDAGAAVVITTHILEVAERMADRIGIIRAGRLVAEGTLAELKAGDAGATLEEVFLRLVTA